MMFKPILFSCLKTYNRKTLVDDLFAGITVGFLALPLAMVFAIACDLPPERGLFTAIVAGFLAAVFGGSRVQVSGPTGAFVLLVGGIASQFGYAGLVYATLLSAVILIFMGVTKMGSLVKFIPFPVTTGFTTGIAVVIFSTQIKDLLGLTMETVPGDFVPKWAAYIQNLSSISIAATFISVLTIVIILVLKRRFPKWPGILIAMIVATVVAQLFGLPVETIGSRFGELPRTLPSPGLPAFDWMLFKQIIAPAFTVAMLGAIESLLSATVADGMIGDRHRSNTELIGQGIANIGSAFFGGIPTTGAIARTATNVKSGAKTPVAAIIHAAILALILLTLGPLAKQVPMAALAGILVVVSYNMSNIHTFFSLFKAPKSDWAVLLLTFILTVFVDLTLAVEVGLILSAAMFIKRMADVTKIGVVTRELRDVSAEAAGDPNSIANREVPDGVGVFEINGPFFFGAVEKFKDYMQILDQPMQVVILRIRHVPAIDASGMYVIEDLLMRCRKKGSTLIISGIGPQPLSAMQKSGLLDKIGPENIVGNIDTALNHAREILGLPQVTPVNPANVQAEAQPSEEQSEQSEQAVQLEQTDYVEPDGPWDESTAEAVEPQPEEPYENANEPKPEASAAEPQPNDFEGNTSEPKPAESKADGAASEPNSAEPESKQEK